MVEVERKNGRYVVSRAFDSLSAAMRAVDDLLSVTEAAFEPGHRAQVSDIAVLDERGVVIDELQRRAEADDPSPHDGRLILPPSNDEE
jgi:hypothetical protein